MPPSPDTLLPLNMYGMRYMSVANNNKDEVHGPAMYIPCDVHFSLSLSLSRPLCAQGSLSNEENNKHSLLIVFAGTVVNIALLFGSCDGLLFSSDVCTHSQHGRGWHTRWGRVSKRYHRDLLNLANLLSL